VKTAILTRAMRLSFSLKSTPQSYPGFDLFVKGQISMDSAPIASEKAFSLEINPNTVYSRVWLMENWPGMHKNRIHQLENKFGLLPLNSGNREAFFVYRGVSILESLEKEAYARRGVSTEDEGN
jgi:hypothetical protein